MKYIITETQFKKFKHQSLIDSLLDKISNEGIESLTDRELEILKNPDNDLDDEPEIDPTEFIIKSLDISGFIKKEDLELHQDDTGVYFEISKFENIDFDYFTECDAVLRCDVSWDSSFGKYILKISPFDGGECDNEKMEVIEFIKTNISKTLSNFDIDIVVDDEDQYSI